MADIAEREAAVFFHTGARQPITLVRGQGTRVLDDAGNEYLDFVAGIAANSLGHCHPAVVDTIHRQAETLIHVSNYFYTEPQVELAELLVEASGLKRIFFNNSGAEANEGCIKLARKWGQTRRDGSYEIIAAENGFHGRTLAAVTATGTPRYSAPFAPLPPGFVHVPFNDVAALRSAITPRTCAIMLEPVQGEGGVIVPDAGYLHAVRDLCDEMNLLLFLDEVQTGMGRTGRMFAYEHEGIRPDLLALAKGLGGGVPIAAFLANERADVFEPGDHGTTFGGQPLTSAVALTVIRTLLDQRIPQQVAVKGATFMQALRSLEDRSGMVAEVRGQGLLVGVELTSDRAAEVVSACRERGLLIGAVGPGTVRFIPPLTVSDDELSSAVAILETALATVGASGGAASEDEKS